MFCDHFEDVNAKFSFTFRLLSADAWTAEDQNYLNPPTPKRKSVHTPFREVTDSKEDAVFKIPLAPSPKPLSPNPKPSIFTKLSPKIESKPLRENGTTTQPPLTTTLFGFSSTAPLNSIFQTSIDKPSVASFQSNNIFGTASSMSQNIFATTKPSNDNLFKSTPSAIFSQASPNIFSKFISSSVASTTESNFVTNVSTTKPLSATDIVQINSHSPATKKNESDELKKLERQKQQIETEMRKEAERLRQEESAKLQRQKELQERIEKDRLERERMEKEKEKEKANALKQQQRIERISEETAVDVVSEFVRQELEVFAEEALDIYQQIENVTEDIYCELLAEIIFEESAEWERVHQEKIEKIECTPIWVPDKSLLQLAPDVHHPLQGETLNLIKRYRHGEPTTISSPTARDKSIDIFDIVSQQLNRKSSTIERIRKRPIFWKCGISIPNSIEEKSCQRIEKWLDKLFVRREPFNSKLFFCEQQFVRSVQQEVAISLRKFRGNEMSNEDGIVDASDLIGLNAMIFVMSAANAKETKRRLLKVLQRDDRNYSVGIVMLNVDKNHEHYLTAELQLGEWEAIPGLKYFYSSDGAAATPFTRNKLLIRCFKWVASNFKFKSSLEMQTTTSFFDQCLGNQFWRRILTSSTHNPGLFKAATDISFIIDTYNTALYHLDNVITEDLSNHPLFPQEFKCYVKLTSVDIPVEYQYFPNDWKNPNRLNQLRNFLTTLRLQPLLLKTSSIDDIQLQLLAYAHRHITDKLRSDRAAYRMIKDLLEFVALNDDQSFEQQITSYNWINSVRFLTLEILQYQYEENVNSIPMEVIYNREKFRQYLNEPWWLQDNSPMKQIRLSFDCMEETDGPTMKKLKPNPSDKDEIQQLIAKGANALAKADAKIDKFKATVNTSREITHDLDSLLYEHERNLRVQKRWTQLEMSD